MKGGTLFSGIGAPELAAPDIDWRWCAETDPFASAVLAARFPDSRNLGDVTEVDWDAVEPVDIVVFGSPCQSFSVAGQRAGLDDPRGNLALVGLRVVERVRPRWVVFENVPGLLSSDEGRDFGAFLGCLGQCGYGFAYRILDAQYFGVPQRRRRVFVVGCLGDWRGAAAVLFEQSCLRWNPPPRRGAGERVADSITGSFAKHGGACAGKDSVLRNAVFGGNNTTGPIEVATACNAHGGPHGRIDFETETFVVPPLMAKTHRGRAQNLSTGFTSDGHIVTHTLRADGFDAGEDGTGRGTPIISVAVASFRWKMGAKAHGIGHALEQAGSVETNAGGYAVAIPIKKPNGSSSNGAARNSIDGADGDPMFSMNADTPHGIFNGMSVRRLTPVECEKLQGFPPGFTAIPYRGKPASDGPRYRALGNAMAVPVIGWILGRILLTAESDQ